MINFFRKTRKKHADDNKPIKYFRYAIGEIVLVVIGILIALSINNWNEERKDTITESIYIKEMLEDFENNLKESRTAINRFEEILPTLLGLIEQSSLNKHTISVDSLNNAFFQILRMPTYSSTDRVYNNIIGTGDLNLIKNQELKTELSRYYKFLNILNLVQTTHEMQLVGSFEPYIIENLDFQAVVNKPDRDYKLPKSIEEDRILTVLNDRKFRNIVTLKWTISTDLLDQNRRLEQINIEIVELLKSEIKE